MLEDVWKEYEKEFKVVKQEIRQRFEPPKPFPDATESILERYLDSYLKGLNKRSLEILSGIDIVKMIQDLEPLEVRTDFEILDHKLKPWQIWRNYAHLDVMGITYEIMEVLDAFNVISTLPILLKINNILIRRTYRDMHPCQTMEMGEFLRDLKADPGRRVKWSQIGLP
jgi:hypothetical protein